MSILAIDNGMGNLSANSLSSASAKGTSTTNVADLANKALTAETSSDSSTTSSTTATTDTTSTTTGTYTNADGDTVSLSTGIVLVAAHGDGHKGLSDPCAGQPKIESTNSSDVQSINKAADAASSASSASSDSDSITQSTTENLTPLQQSLSKIYGV
jgi:hypothetical protein